MVEWKLHNHFKVSCRQNNKKIYKKNSKLEKKKKLIYKINIYSVHNKLLMQKRQKSKTSSCNVSLLEKCYHHAFYTQPLLTVFS